MATNWLIGLKRDYPLVVKAFLSYYIADNETIDPHTTFHHVMLFFTQNLTNFT